MKNTILSLSLMLILSIGYKASSQEKAFNEGDKILTIGVSGGYSGGYNRFQGILLRPSVTYDYFLKKAKGIISLGAYLNFYSKKNEMEYSYDNGLNELIKTSYTTRNFSTGLRLGIHYPFIHHNFDVYGGLALGLSSTGTIDYTRKTFGNNGVLTSIFTPLDEYYTTFDVIPLFGLRYSPISKISINIEYAFGNYPLIGLGYKFSKH
jgi:hypothetical protein